VELHVRELEREEGLGAKISKPSYYGLVSGALSGTSGCGGWWWWWNNEDQVVAAVGLCVHQCEAGEGVGG
jgi:hypothetical protein